MENKFKEKLDYPLVLSAKEVAEILGVSKRVAYEVMDYKGFPLIRINGAKGTKRVQRDAFFNWLDNFQQAN